jgi:hypothetical protein
MAKGTLFLAVCSRFYFHNCKKIRVLYSYLCCQKTAELPVGLVVERVSGKELLQGDVMSKMDMFGGYICTGVRDGNKLLSYAV